MNTEEHTKHQPSEHGSARSYIVGFVLSLIFSLIPYYMVINKTVTGSSLVFIILAFAVIQMLIQIFFFLHLGRGPKPLYNIVFFGATVGIILIVVFGSIFIMDHLHYNMDPSNLTKKLAQKEGINRVGEKETGACRNIGQNHKIYVVDGSVITPHIYARQCDTLTFINEDNKLRKITFGTHPEHGDYAGETELTVRRGRGSSITLNQIGEYNYHDHDEPTVFGSFTVTE